MTTVFLDTVGLLAIWDRTDQWHAAASRAFDTMLAEQARVVTTTFVLLECGNAATRRPYRAQVDILRRQLAARGELIEPTSDDWNDAWRQYGVRAHGNASIVDHVSIIVMRRLGLTTAFTNDAHFRQAGYTTLF